MLVRRLGLAPLLLCVNVACARNARSAGAPCQPPELPGGAPVASPPAATLVGEYRLTLVATVGPKAGRRVEGRLSLKPQNRELLFLTGPGGVVDTTARVPAFGTTEAAVEDVGALRLGDLRSSDPRRPGVAVLETPGAVVIRLGSEANRRDVLRFDGGYTALYVRQATPTGFTGTWASGVTGPEAEGYFCAERMGR